MREIGKIQQLQIQTSSLKVGERPHRRYDPSPIMQVERLRITPEGVIGIAGDGSRITDIHHARHPHSRNDGDNAVSIGFTAHYTLMRDRFGAHMHDGVGGENIIIACTEAYTPDQLGMFLAIQRDDSLYRFRVVKVAAPCVEFSTFAAQQPISGEALKDTLQFLHEGRRGFLIASSDHIEFEIKVGDAILSV